MNNAGFGAQGPISESPLDLVHRVFDVNVFGALDLTQRVLAKFHQDGRSGRVIVVSSAAGLLETERTPVHLVEALVDLVEGRDSSSRVIPPVEFVEIAEKFRCGQIHVS